MQVVIGFQQMKKEDVLSFLETYQKETRAHIDGIAMETQQWCPIWRGSSKKDVDAWINEQFTIRAFYSDLYGVLCVVNPYSCMQSLFQTVITFDNNSVKDYYRETWQPISGFTSVYDGWLFISRKEFYRVFQERYGKIFQEYYGGSKRCEALTENYIEMHKRQFCYEEICRNIMKEKDTALHSWTVNAIPKGNDMFSYKFLACCYEYHKMAQAQNEMF